MRHSSMGSRNDDIKPRAEIKVAVKLLDKSKIATNEVRLRQLVSEIRVHWALEKCDGALRLIELFEDDAFVYIVLEY